MEKQYDNSNKGSAWDAKATRGIAEIGGTRYLLVIVRNPKSTGNQPTHDLFLREMGDSANGVYHAPLFKETKEGVKRVLAGSVRTGNGEWWISVYLNDKDPDGRKPVLGLTFQPKEARQHRTPEPAPTTRGRSTPPPPPLLHDQDGIPF